ncbi:hypothetical protein AB0F81_11580 [Actinoplanes sp. NPDC024001]|uniref:hypothetical protein n=1 Tax=Actinoplanes sp. NPDC024001 TaxID=3154598 RepID=UPI0033FF3DD0
MGTAVLGGLLGLALVAFGARILLRRRAPALIERSFRSAREAGCYHLLFGLAVLLFVAGARLPGARSGQATAVLAVALVGVAVVRFRPRGRRRDDE